jgi:S-adenosylmethionine-dependent methyltransferase
VLTFADYAAMESTVPGADEFAEIMACEQQAGRTDPYRRIAAMLHVIATPLLP